MNFETTTFRFEDLTLNYDKQRIPLSSGQREKRQGQYRYYGAQGVIDYVDDYIFDGKYLLIAEDGENLKSKKQDVAQIVEGKFWVNNHAHVVQGNALCLTEYLCYLLNHTDLSGYITGSAQPKLSQANLNAIAFEVPSIETQQKIVLIISALDEKIAINRAINDNLERQVSEIYKSWYQDYSCVEGIPLVETEYGHIPKGWHYSILGDLCKSVSVTHKFGVEKLVFLNTGDVEEGRFLHSNYMAVSDMPGQAKKTIALGDILYSEIRPINKHYAYVTFPSEDYVVSTKLMVIRAFGIESRRLYHYLTTEDVITKLQMEAESRSGTFPQIRFDNISKLPILIADDVTEAAFTTLLRTVYDQIGHNNSENEKLVSLRDNLLPRLMSGEINVSAVQL